MAFFNSCLSPAIVFLVDVKNEYIHKLAMFFPLNNRGGRMSDIGPNGGNDGGNITLHATLVTNIHGNEIIPDHTVMKYVRHRLGCSIPAMS